MDHVAYVCACAWVYEKDETEMREIYRNSRKSRQEMAKLYRQPETGMKADKQKDKWRDMEATN